MNRYLITIFIMLLSTFVFSQNDVFKKVDAIVNAQISETDPALMVGIVSDGKVIYEKYRGLAYLQHGIKADEKTRSNIASTAKQFTALMVLQLSRQGKLSLEDDIRTYLPALYPEVKEEIKIRHVLNHTSGIRDYCDFMGIMNKIWWKQVGLDNDDVIEMLEKQQDLAFVPGTRYIYSNSGYVVLAKIIESITSQKFTDYSKQFFRNLGMKETYFIERYMGVIPNRAEPYSDWGEGVWLQTPTVTKTVGEGFLYTTLKDQLIYEVALQNAYKDTNELLLQSQQSIPNSEITTYGYGVELKDQLNRKAVYHAGATGGYNAHTLRFPDERWTVFVMSNNGNLDSSYIANTIAAAALPEIKAEITYNTSINNYKISSKKVTVSGQYRSENGYLTRIVEEEGNIYLRQGSNIKIQVIPESDGLNTYYLGNDSGTKVGFTDDSLSLFYPDGELRSYKRIDVLPVSVDDMQAFVGNYYSAELDMSFDLRLNGEQQLKLMFSNRSNERDVQVLNRNEMLSRNFTLKVERDQFGRVSDILLSLGRAENNRFQKKTNLIYQPKITLKMGSINVTTIGSGYTKSSQILITKNDEAGNEIWFKKYGGSSYDKANSILETKDGYLIIGSTSSYGNGNYDMFVIKTDKEGKKLWQNTYGESMNEYGYTAEKTETGYLIKGTIQKCSSEDILKAKCKTSIWLVSIDEKGKELSNEILEEKSI